MPYADPEKARISKAAYYQAHKEEAAKYNNDRYHRLMNDPVEREKRNLYYRKWRGGHKDEISGRRSKNNTGRLEALAGRPRPERCECCGEIPTGPTAKSRLLRWDHSHETGGFRGWLCDSCNRTIGHANESTARLRACADYLEGLLPGERPLSEVTEIAMEK